MEQETIIQMLLKDMQKQGEETKAQTEKIHELSTKLEHQAEQLMLKEQAIIELEIKLNEISNTEEYFTEEKSQSMSSDNLSRSFGDERILPNHRSFKNINKLEHSTAMDKKSIRQRRLQLPVPNQLPKVSIAFSVAHYATDLVHAGPIVYEAVNLNLGGGFKHLSNKFTVPSNGLYLFSVLSSISSYPSGHTVFLASVYKNNTGLDMIFVHSDNIRYEQTSVTVITQLNVGDSVWVEIGIAMNVNLRKLSFAGIEQETIIQNLLKDMQEQRKETKAQTKMIHEMFMKLEHQAEQLILKEQAITELEMKLNEISNTKEYFTVENSQSMSSDNISRSSGDERTMLNYERNHDKTLKSIIQLKHSTSINKRSIRQRRLQLPVPTQIPIMNIAFSVAHYATDLVHAGPIVYDEVYLNSGGGFQPLSSNFTAPSNGLYLFSVLSSISSSPGEHTVFLASVYKNNHGLEKIYIYNDNVRNEQRSVTVITQLNVGDSVWVEIVLATNVKLRRLSFAGVLISQM
ncbi:hypothetical protein ACF0H5_011947 [Mactra antiquata]